MAVLGVAAGLTLAIKDGSDSAALAAPAGAQARPKAASQARVARAYARLPLAFEENRGQSDRRVKFSAHGDGYQLFLTAREAVLSLTRPAAPARPRGVPRTGHMRRGAVVRLRLLGAADRPRVQGQRRLPGVSNYLIGRDRSRWHRGVRRYARARYSGVYPGVDLIYYGHKGGLEYDFRVAPRADPGAIAFKVSGARGLRLDRSGNLVISTAAGPLRQLRPVVYQGAGAERQPVAGRYVLRSGHRVSFELGRYDHRRALVIDPALVYSTYLAGTTSEGGQGGGANGALTPSVVAADSSGAAYVSGGTYAPDFPTTTGAFQTTKGTLEDVFVTKLSPAGDELVYSTYVGGNRDDAGTDVAVDDAGRAYVTGATYSTQDDPATSQDDRFPTTPGALQRTPPNTSNQAFVSVLKADGSGLDYSTFLGGSDNNTYGRGIAIGPAGHAYVTGSTNSSLFPIKAPSPATPLQTSLAGSPAAFVAELDTGAQGDNSLVYSTYLGGDRSSSFGVDIAVDGAGDAYLAGQTDSSSFPTHNAFQGTRRGLEDVFVAKLDATGSALLYSTFLGGIADDSAAGIALDASGDAYVAGSTTAADFPTKGAFQPGRGGNSDAFVAKLDPAASGADSLVYSSFLGGVNDDFAAGVAVTPAGSAYVAGSADSDFSRVLAVGGFPTVDPVARVAAYGDAFLAAVKPDGSGLSFSSSFGGGAEDVAGGVALDASGNAYLAGNTASTDFPTRNALQAENHVQLYGNDAPLGLSFVAKLAPVDSQAPLVTGLGHRSGPAGTAVAIGGHGFTGASAVRFGSADASSFTVDSDGQITAIAPPGVSGSVAVTVTTPQGSSPANPIAMFRYAQGTWDVTGSLRVARLKGEAATPLGDGRVLVAGGTGQLGTLAATELYDPTSATWSATAPMGGPRQRFTATVLRDGRVLVAGGLAQGLSGATSTLPSAELYDPASQTWSPTGSMAQARSGHTASLLPDGRVLVAGGDTGTAPLASAELYDPATGKWAAAGPLVVPHTDHTATVLGNGTVLVIGGQGSDLTPLATAELYDPATDSWSTTGSMATARVYHTATRLGDGRVLVAGGAGLRYLSVKHFFLSLASAEIYDPATGEFDVTAAMADPRAGAAAALLADGRVLVTGGADTNTSQETAELFDPTTTSWSSAGPMNHHRGIPASQGIFSLVVAAVPLASGKVLVFGDAPSVGASSELYSPVAAAAPTPPAGSAPGPAPAASDRVAPRISHLRMTHRAFAATKKATRKTASAAARRRRAAPKRRTTFKYTLSEAASVRIVIARSRPGRRRGKRCVAAARKPRHAKTCTRLARKGTLTRRSRRGANRVAFTGRIGSSKALAPGRYRATLTATDAAQNRSKPKTITFRILKR